MTTYLEQSEELKPFYEKYPTLNQFKQQIALKKESYSASYREVLVAALKGQYKAIPHSKSVDKNVILLENENTFTVTTGHQLSLMTGPLYFLYKIISTINLCKSLKKAYPDSNFVPLYWMASEDHDFEEISTFRFQDKSIRWSQESEGAVGELSLEELQTVLDVFEQHLGDSENAKQLKEWIRASYRSSQTLSEATFRLVNILFWGVWFSCFRAKPP